MIDRLGEDNVYRTDEDGTVKFITDGESLWIIADSQDIYLPARRLQCKALGAVGSFAELVLALFQLRCSFLPCPGKRQANRRDDLS